VIIKNIYSISNTYFAIWALFLPISSFLLFPSIQGTTPAYLSAMLAIPLGIFVDYFTKKSYTKNLLIVILIFIALNIISQFGLALSELSFNEDMNFVDPEDNTILFRSSMFTQSIYMLASASTFCFVSSFYKKCWNKFILLGAVLLATYGLYEFCYFIIFQTNGDFVSNRTFGEGKVGSGSLFQTITLSSLTIQRLKSLTGEPSMYAFTILPFWIFAIHSKRKIIQLFLFTTLILSTSTTAFIGIITYLLNRIFYLKYKDLWSCWVIGCILCVIFLFLLPNIDLLIDALNYIFLNKITGTSDSGMDRASSLEASLSFYSSSSLTNKLFGIGFGYVRSLDMLSTLLVNNGLIGLLIFTGLFFYPVIKLENSYESIGLKSAIIVVYITMMISVPEYAYLSVWLFLGIAYSKLHFQSEAKKF